MSTEASIITHRERQKYREGLAELEDLRTRIEKHIAGKENMPHELWAVLSKMSQTTDPNNQLAFVSKLYNDLNDQYDEHLRYAAQFRLSPFCEYMMRDEVPAPHHEFLIERLEDIEEHKLLRLMVSMPPGHAKTSYSSHRFPAWYLGRHPNHKWLQAAHTMDFARNRLGKPVRGLIQNDRYRNVFPEVYLSHDSAAADFFEFGGHSGYYKAVGVGVGVAGYRADIQAVDDPFKSREDADRKVVRDGVFDWYSADFTTRMARKDMPQFIVATRWHPDDLCGRLEEMNKEGKGLPFEIINLPAVALDDDPLGRAPGQALWEHFPLEILMELKAKLPGRDWNSLYMGNPVDEYGGVLTKDNVYRYKELPKDKIRHGQVINKVIKRRVLSVDCAEKATERSDYTAVTIWIETVDGKHYLQHAARIRAEFPRMVQFIEHLARDFSVDLIICEDRGAGTQYIQLRKNAAGPVPVLPIQTKQQSKEFRFDGVTPMFIGKQVFLPEKADWVADVEAELFAFPVGRYDDYVDSVSQYLNWARENGVRRGVRKMKSSFAA